MDLVQILRLDLARDAFAEALEGSCLDAIALVIEEIRDLGDDWRAIDKGHPPQYQLDAPDRLHVGEPSAKCGEVAPHEFLLQAKVDVVA